MSWVAVAIAGSAVLGAAVSSQGASQAGQQQTQAGQQAQQQLMQIGQNVAPMYTPYQQTGQLGLNNINQMASSGYLTNQFNNQDLQSNLAPNYQFMLNQGLGANTENANVGGGGSNVNRSNQVFAQGYAGNAYQNAFSNYQAQRQNILNNNLGIAGVGQNAVQGAANAQLGIGTNISNITQGIGNAQAASTIGQANAYSGGIQGAGNAYALSNILGNNGGGASTAGILNGTSGTGGFSGVDGASFSLPVA